jgi:hypothetical protein
LSDTTIFCLFLSGLLGELREGFIDPEEVFWGLGPEYTGMKEPSLYRRPQVGESVMVMDVGEKGMFELIGKAGRIVKRPAGYRGSEDVTPSYQVCEVALDGQPDFFGATIVYGFRVEWLLYEDMDVLDPVERARREYQQAKADLWRAEDELEEEREAQSE